MTVLQTDEMGVLKYLNKKADCLDGKKTPHATIVSAWVFSLDTMNAGEISTNEPISVVALMQ